MLAHSYESGTDTDFLGMVNVLVAEQFCGVISFSALNSSKVKSEKSLTP